MPTMVKEVNVDKEGEEIYCKNYLEILYMNQLQVLCSYSIPQVFPTI